MMQFTLMFDAFTSSVKASVNLSGKSKISDGTGDDDDALSWLIHG